MSIRKQSWSKQLAKRVLLRTLAELRGGQLELVCPRETHVLGDEPGGLRVTLVVHDERVFARVLFGGGDVGFGEAYMDGDWSSPDPVAVLRLLVRNLPLFDERNRGFVLLVMGLSMLLGGLRYKEQEFQPIVARVNASSMNLAVIAMLLPTAMDATSAGIDETTLQRLSVAVAVVLILVYALTLLFSMRTHSYLFDVGIAEIESEEGTPATEESEPKVNLWLWVGILLGVTLLVALESELLVDTLEEATSQLGLTALFTGVILLPVIGNAAEHATAVTVAMKNKMDLSVSVAVGSSLQIALFVAPVLVIAGWFMGQPMDLDFNPFELVAVAVSVLIANSISSDGKSNWLEGILLLAAYVVLGLAFYFHPIIEGLA